MKVFTNVNTAHLYLALNRSSRDSGRYVVHLSGPLEPDAWAIYGADKHQMGICILAVCHWLGYQNRGSSLRLGNLSDEQSVFCRLALRMCTELEFKSFTNTEPVHRWCYNWAGASSYLCIMMVIVLMTPERPLRFPYGTYKGVCRPVHLSVHVNLSVHTFVLIQYFPLHWL